MQELLEAEIVALARKDPHEFSMNEILMSPHLGSGGGPRGGGPSGSGDGSTTDAAVDAKLLGRNQGYAMSYFMSCSHWA